MSIRAARASLLASALAPGVLALTSPAVQPPPLRVAAVCPISSFDVGLLSIFAKLHGRLVVPLEPSSRLPAAAVTDGAADLLTGVVAGDELGDLVITREVLPTRLVAVTRRPATRAASIEGLRGTRIAILRGSRARAAVQAAKISGAQLVEHGSAGQASAALREGAVAALLLELPDAFAARRLDPELEFGAFLGPKTSLVYAVAPRDRGVAEELDRFLESIRRTPSWSALLARYYGPEALEVLGRTWSTK